MYVQEDAERLQRSQSKAPSVLMKSLVEKLKTDLAEKERKQKVKIKNTKQKVKNQNRKWKKEHFILIKIGNCWEPEVPNWNIIFVHKSSLDFEFFRLYFHFLGLKRRTPNFSIFISFSCSWTILMRFSGVSVWPCSFCKCWKNS